MVKATTIHLILICLFLILLVSLNSCFIGYGLGNTAEGTRYQPKPVYQDKDTSANYISAYISHNNDLGYFQGEENMFGGARFHRANTFKNFNFAYGAFGYAGNYDVTFVKDLQGKKFFYGGGISGEANLNIPLFNRLDWRILGVRVTGWAEGGEYARFRERISSEEFRALSDTVFIDQAPNNFLTNVSLNSELVYKQDNFNLGLNATYGYSFDPTTRSDAFSYNIGLGGHFARGRYTVFGNYNVTYNPTFIHAHFQIKHYSIGFAYQI